MSGSRFAEEIHPALSLAGGLVAQQRENAAAFEHLLDVGPAAFFGKNILAGAAAKVIDEPIEIHII